MSKARNLSKVIVDTNGVVDRDSLDVESVAKTGSYNDLTDKPTIPSGTVTSVAASAGTGISVSGSPITSSGTITITNTAPDQTVALTQGGTTTITGTYPNFTISSADQYVGTVTSVAASVPTGLSVSGSPVTSSGTLAITYSAGYSIPTDAKQTNWDTAYGWGNHASAGYATYPSQTGNTGKFLTTDGSVTSWAAVDALPSQTGNTGKYLTTDGTSASWDALATVANSGSYNDLTDKPTLTTNLDGLTDVVITSPASDQVLKYNGTNWVNGTGGGSMVYPSAGIAVSTGSAWGTSYTDANKIPANYIPTLNQNTTGSSGSCTGNAATATTATNQSGGSVNATTGTFSTTKVYSSLTGANDGTINIPTQVVSSSAQWASYLHASTVISGVGYVQHMSLGSYRPGGGGWGHVYLGVGGSDSYPTTAFLFNEAGTFTAPGNVTAYSDERLKKDWEDLSPTFLEDLAKVKYGTYTRIDSGERQVGASAQDMQKILPESVQEGEHLSLAYGNAALVAAIELAKQVVELKKEIAELKAK